MPKVKGYKTIVKDKGYCGGKPRFENSRLPVWAISDFIAAGWTNEDLIEGFPALNDERIEEARSTCSVSLPGGLGRLEIRGINLLIL